jgi:hypothetical protein
MTRRREENSGATKRRTGNKSATDLEDWRVDGLPGERPSDRKRSAAAGNSAPSRPTTPRRKPSRGSEWLPASGKRRRSRSRNGNGNGRAGIEELERRAAELERKLRLERRRAREEIEKLRAQLRGRALEQESAVSPTGRVDANTASFEQLRELGFTPAQSAKLIAGRESAGGFKAKSDLRGIPGLSKSARELVEKRLSVRR